MAGHGTGGFARFPTTHASAIRGLASADEGERRRSWDAIISAYWRPAYKHVRVRWQRSREDAEDLTQAFFSRTMEHDALSGYDPARGRFRTFVRVCLDRFVSNARRAERRDKRGGGGEVLPLDFEGAEAELALATDAQPDTLFDREWERALFAAAIERLRAVCEEEGRQSHFQIFERYDLAAEERPTYEELARELGVPATTVTNRLAFARRELRRLVVERLALVTGGDDELALETKLLFATPPPEAAR